MSTTHVPDESSPDGKNLEPADHWWQAGVYPVTLGHQAHAPTWSRYGVVELEQGFRRFVPHPEVIWPAMTRLVPTSRLVGSDLRAWHRSCTDYGFRRHTNVTRNAPEAPI